MKKSVALLALLLLFACAPTTKEGAAPTADFRFGTEGLYMEFMPNLPPPRLFDTEKITVMLQLENKGTSQIPATGWVYISGFDKNIIQILTTKKSLPSLGGRGPYLPKGDIGAVDFTGSLRRLSELRVDKYQPTILATACYPYETVASAQVCIDPNPYSAVAVQKICTPAAVSLGSQGAPIAVTSVEVEPSLGKTRFRINIQNAGAGDLYKVEKVDKCGTGEGLAVEEMDYVNIAEVKVSGNDIRDSCKPSRDWVRLANKQATLYCEVDTTKDKSAYLTPLTIILKYGYRQSISKSIEIRPTA